MRLGFLLLLFVAGCAQPPLRCESPRALYVVSHGWHTGVIVGRSDLAKHLPALAEFGDKEYLEIGWGDEQFYRAPKGSVGLALRALFASPSSALQVVGFSGAPRDYFPRSDFAEVRSDESGYRAALTFVADSFRRTHEGQLTRLGRSLYGDGWFYATKDSFHAFNTCNTWVARAIEKTGHPISTSTVTARGLFVQLARGGC